jgi:hypothetical protein
VMPGNQHSAGDELMFVVIEALMQAKADDK